MPTNPLTPNLLDELERRYPVAAALVQYGRVACELTQVDRDIAALIITVRSAWDDRDAARARIKEIGEYYDGYLF